MGIHHIVESVPTHLGLTQQPFAEYWLTACRSEKVHDTVIHLNLIHAIGKEGCQLRRKILGVEDSLQRGRACVHAELGNPGHGELRKHEATDLDHEGVEELIRQTDIGIRDPVDGLVDEVFREEGE